MRAEDLQRFVRAAPFQPFRITMNSGRTFDIRHPEMLHLTRSIGLVFDRGDDGIPDEFEMISLVLIESVRNLEVPATSGNGQASS
jgi:hypothetical protein